MSKISKDRERGQNSNVVDSPASVSFISDIAVRKQREDALKESDSIYRALIETTDTGYVIIDSEGAVVDANQEYVRLAGYSDLNEILGKSVLEWTADYEKEKNAAAVAKCIRDGFIRNLEIDYLDRFGKITPVEVNATVMFRGNQLQIFTLCRDITSCKRAGVELRLSEERFSKAFNVSPTTMSISTFPEGRYVDVNEAYIKNLGYRREELIGFTKSELHIWEKPEDLAAAVQILSEQKLFRNMETLTRTKSGELRIGLVSADIFEIDGAEYMLAVFDDITERMMAEEAFRESEEKYRLANQELAFQNQEKDKRAAELVIANQELAFQNQEKDKRAAELVIANQELAFQNQEKDKRAAELVIANQELAFQKEALKQSEEKYHSLVVNLNDVIDMLNAEGYVTYISPVIERFAGYKTEEIIGQPFISYVHPEDRQGLLESFRRTLSGQVEPAEFRLLRKDGASIYVRSFSRALAENGQVSLAGVLSDITERKRAEDELRESHGKLAKTFEQTVESLASIAEMRDPYTAGHQVRVASLACRIASEIGIPAEQIGVIRTAAMLHDIGKIVVPPEILNKPGRLSAPERSLVEGHAQASYDILKTIEFEFPIAEIIWQHHEKLDGSGYPRGLSGDSILKEARILTVADIVEAMVSHRPYRPALSLKTALEEIGSKKGLLYDAEVVDACLRIFSRKGFRQSVWH
jgi:PAS domain S-box-containing protein/putative nucleotidyltransferase with HDIG domain